ncbi:MAG: type II toxin-antitoxin system RelE/ParE family toxin [Methylobacter sp.]|nr:type II toxin-antitoxin system RelE/ParE family toxin [Methylobacter sp.]
MRDIRLTRAAEQDLEDIWIYTLSEWGEVQANKYLALIQDCFGQLIDNPAIGKARPDIKMGYRALQVQQHIIFYRLEPEFIAVIGILHMRMEGLNST